MTVIVWIDEYSNIKIISHFDILKIFTREKFPNCISSVIIDLDEWEAL